jgi:hypothetical protein
MRCQVKDPAEAMDAEEVKAKVEEGDKAEAWTTQTAMAIAEITCKPIKTRRYDYAWI